MHRGAAGGTRWSTVSLISIVCLFTGGLLGTTPAVADSSGVGGSWGSALEVSAEPGRDITLSKNGRVAAWIDADSGRPGNARAAWYRKAKNKWSAPRLIPRMVGVSSLKVSSTGRYVFGESRTGYPESTEVLVATRKKKNAWGRARTLVAGPRLTNAKMSQNARTVVWVDWTGSSYSSASGPPVSILSRSRTSDEWSPPTVVAEVLRPRRVVLSGDGSTVLWFDGAGALQACDKQADGLWSPPALIKQYPSGGGVLLTDLGLDWSASTAVWLDNQQPESNVLFARRTHGTWSATDYVTDDWVHSAVVSPNGRTVAYSTRDKKMTVRTWTGTTWGKPEPVGPRRPTSRARIAVSNRTLAWARGGAGGSALWASVNTKGEWAGAKRVTRTAAGTVVSLDGRTLAWVNVKSKRVLSVRR